jgi:hypothetical protein
LLEKKASPMSMIGFPLLLIPLTIYNIIVFLMPGVSFADPLLKLTLMSGVEWPLTLGDILLALGILLLLFEVIKGARPGAKYLTDHLLSLILFGGAVAEFLLWPRFGTSTYFLLTTLAMADFLSGIALRARRGVQVTTVSTAARRGVPPPDSNPPEPRFDPVPGSVAAANPAAGSVLPDHSQPRIEHPHIAPIEPSPEVPSPGLQPGSGSPPSPDLPPR